MLAILGPEEVGPIKDGERSVAGALHWLYRHQLSKGNWSLQNYKQRCSDQTCTGAGTAHADAGALHWDCCPSWPPAGPTRPEAPTANASKQPWCG